MQQKQLMSRSFSQLREEFDQGWEVQMEEENGVHDVAALLKEFFRDLPDPLLTRDLYTAFLSTTREAHIPKTSKPHLAVPTIVLLTYYTFFFYSVGPFRTGARTSAAHLFASSVQQRHAAPLALSVGHRGCACRGQPGQRGTGGMYNCSIIPWRC